MEANPDAVSRIAVDHIALHDDILTCERYPQRESFAHRDVGLGAHVEAARADVLGAGHPGRVAAVEAHIHYHSRAIVLSSFVAREFFFPVLVYHFVPSATLLRVGYAERAGKLQNLMAELMRR